MGERELVALLNLSSLCLVMVKWLFLALPQDCLRFVIVVFPDHTHLLFCITVSFISETFCGAYPRTRSCCFFKFLWNSGPDRITRKLAVANISSGGLRMTCIYSSIKALKYLGRGEQFNKQTIQPSTISTQLILISFITRRRI